MTRETKIGLLVGLAFIIVVGVLLSEQLTRSTETPQARIETVGPNVRQGVTIAGANHARNTATVHAPAVAPHDQVPTAGEVNQPHGSAIVTIGVGDGNPLPPTRRGAAPRTRDAAPVEPDARVDVGAGPARDPERTAPPRPVDNGETLPLNNDTHLADNTHEDPRARAARLGGEAVVPIDNHGRAIPGNGNGNNNGAADPRPANPTMKVYQAQAGDSLSRIAARQLGADTAANRQAIIRANPSLADSPDKIIAGRNYNIPVVDAGGSRSPAGPAGTAMRTAPPAPAPVGPQPAPERTDRAARPAAPAAGEHVYVVKKGDTLWGIATHEVGTSGAIPAIQELNKDVLKAGATLREGMKLKLPAKPVTLAESTVPVRR